MVALFLFVYCWGSVGSEGELHSAGNPQAHNPIVELVGSAGGPTEVGPALDGLGRDGRGTAGPPGNSFAKRVYDDQDRAYEQEVRSFVGFYGNTINETDPLVHKLLMHSEGAGRMTEAEAEELGDLLSEMGDASDSEVIGSYPEGYTDCDGYLRAGATSLDLAADSIHGFNETADMEHLRDYRRLIAMYMRATADAQWCVSDHLHREYP